MSLNDEMHAPIGYQCPFCLLAAGVEDDRLESRQSDIVYRDDAVLAFICSRQYPNNSGHVLVVPVAHYENLYELPDELGAHIHRVAKRIALTMKAAYRCSGISTRQHNEPAGNQDVWHYHLHIFPRYENDALYLTSSALMPPSERSRYAALFPRASA